MNIGWNFCEAGLLGVGLAMDALAVSVALGAAERRQFTTRKILLTALFFGGFQFLMPGLGWLGGSFAGHIAQRYGRYFAGVLLLFIGTKMILERDPETPPAFGIWQLTVLAFATSIDALLVGVGYACLGRTAILADITIIGVVTAVISVIGCLAGRFSGKFLGSHCAIIGGLVLIAIGIKIIFLG